MYCAITVRRIKPDTYDDFRKAWEPDPWLPKLTRAFVLRNQDDPQQVLTIGYFDADETTLDEIRDSPEVMAEEDQRLRRIAEFEERILLNGIFELVEEVRPPGAPE
jgi:hypothetical protein